MDDEKTAKAVETRMTIHAKDNPIDPIIQLNKALP